MRELIMAKSVNQSVEPNIADLANDWLKSYKLDYKLEQESLNTEIDQALNEYFSKSGESINIRVTNGEKKTLGS